MRTVQYLLCLAMFIGGPLARADTILTPGSTCRAIVPGKGKSLQWTPRGLTNTSATATINVLCPFERQGTGMKPDLSDRHWWGAAIVFSRAAGSGRVEARCTLREYVGGRRASVAGKRLSLASEEHGAMAFRQRRVASVAASSFAAICLLPPRTTITTLVSNASAKKSNRPVNDAIAALGASS